jgi:SAM-dependent methyltransferase
VGEDAQLRLASSFGVAAPAYAEHRPSYAQAAVRWALKGAPGPRVLDLGAGTGKLTAVLAALGADVVAVEPDAAMLAELRRALPKVATFTGDAEAIPLADASVDAVLAGNAMHWFDMDVAGPQIARVLTKGGTLAGLWNLFDDRVEWVAELARISGAAAIGSRDTLTAWRSAGATRRYPELGSLRWFGAVEKSDFVHGQQDRGITPGDVRDEGGNAGHAGTGTRHDAQPDPCVPHE